MTITINDKEMSLKYGFKALMMYETITNGVFEPKHLSDIIIFFYCCVLAAKNEITYDDFVEWLDDNPNEIENFTKWLNEQIDIKSLKKETGKESK